MPFIDIETEEQFYDLIIKSKEHDKKYIFCDFFAKWCRPCKKIMPDLEKLSDKYNDKILFIKVNINKTPSLSDKFGICKLPTFLIFNNGSSDDIHTKIQGSDLIKIEDTLRRLDQGVIISKIF